MKRVMSDLIRVLNPNYKPKNDYERVLRWLGYLDRFLKETAFTSPSLGLSDSELERMARILSTPT